MIKNMYERVKEMHRAFGQKRLIETDGEDARADLVNLRTTLITEEYVEVADELDLLEGRHPDASVPNLAKELADLLVVVLGTADIFDIPIDDVFDEVMDSNMSKLGDDGKPVLREDGKFLKGPNYRPANVARFFDAVGDAR